MSNTENLIHKKDSAETHITLKTFYGSRYVLYTINLGLLCFLLILGIISVALYSISPKREIPTSHTDTTSSEKTHDLEHKELTTIISNKENKGQEDFDIIFARNIFSAERKEWVIKPKLPEPIQQETNIPTIKTPPKPPKKIVLYGIIMVRNVKKAMINNPNVGVRSNKTIYIEEGDVIERPFQFCPLNMLTLKRETNRMKMRYPIKPGKITKQIEL